MAEVFITVPSEPVHETVIVEVPGFQGAAGRDGKDGKDGKTPVLGVDYFTEADKKAIVDAVIAELVDGDKEVY